MRRDEVRKRGRTIGKQENMKWKNLKRVGELGINEEGREERKARKEREVWE